MAQLDAVAVYHLLHGVVVRHFYDCGHLAQPLLIYFLVVYGIDVGHVACGVRLQIGLDVIFAQ